MIQELLFYDKNYFDYFKKNKEKEGFNIVSVTEYMRNFELANDVSELNQIVDISSLSGLNSLQYNAESLFPYFNENITFISDKENKKNFEYELRFCFIEFTDLEIVEGIIVTDEDEIKFEKPLKHKKIIDISNEEVYSFLKAFSSEIYGHEKFKDDFSKLITNFRVFNKLGEHKILSLFLMGDSGVGKTEVARAIHKCLGGKGKLAKINFGNYSSDNSLNSLIGSPRGYIGSEEGEIFIRVKNSDIGLILIDEFEKSNSTLFNYFLDVLENGKMSSSLSEEIDLNGFIIIFTSNINKEDFTKIISPELRSRFDYKGYFTLLFHRDKQKFVDFRIKSIIQKFKIHFNKELPESIEEEILEKVNVSQFKNMRDLNKSIKNAFVECLVKPRN
ncbi:AAA family ATPase [Flavobacterium sp. LS1R10]|uniref:AAA family ATPase n=1 Tax=Flavobacterium sp. LS1R10 TaxID=2497482 RepID=UPI000F8383C1|nr:AAA family ATPase [Flavobacterium sp. LS1R10]RTY75144.1 ATP-dependent Clp protease ATP-binding subunit [Flavobacterium sp. LS1R10]